MPIDAKPVTVSISALLADLSKAQAGLDGIKRQLLAAKAAKDPKPSLASKIFQAALRAAK